MVEAKNMMKLQTNLMALKHLDDTIFFVDAIVFPLSILIAIMR